MAVTEIRWLHLSDLHAGQPKERDRYENIRAALFDDLRRLSNEGWTWDVVFFTGDLAFRGTTEEYAKVSRRLGEILREIRILNEKRRRKGDDATPCLLPVPGNHDLERPDEIKAAAVRGGWAQSSAYREAFWRGGNPHLRDVVDEAFKAWLAWFKEPQGRAPEHMATTGIVPGDYTATVDVRGVKLGVVGLNTAFLHLSDGGFGELDARVEQLRAVCGDYDQWSRDHHFRVLLTHHPPAWLTKAGQEALSEEVRRGDRFDVHLYGHMHEHAHVADPGTIGYRHAVQGCSLFGAEEDGHGRRHGYSAGVFELEAPKRKLDAPKRTMKVYVRDGHRTKEGWAFGPVAPSERRSWFIAAELGPAPADAGRDPLATLKEGPLQALEVADPDQLPEGPWVFLSASVPSARFEPSRRAHEAARVANARPEEIESFVQAFCAALRDKGYKVAWGGHPSITEALLDFDGTHAEEPWLYVFQHAHFGLRLPDAVHALARRPGVKLVIVNDHASTRDLALEGMRKLMLAVRGLRASVFVGGMEGVKQEWELCRQALPSPQCYAVGAGGGAAKELLREHPTLLRGKLLDSAPLWASGGTAAEAIVDDILAGPSPEAP